MVKIGPLEVETKITLSGLLATAGAFLAIIAAWYNLQTRMAMDELKWEETTKRQEEQVRVLQRAVDTLDSVQNEIGIEKQRLDDADVGPHRKR